MREDLLDGAVLADEVDANVQTAQRPLAPVDEHAEPGVIREGDRDLRVAFAVRRRAIVRKALADAMKHNLVTRNVADAADPPRIPRTQMRTWSARELRAFLHHVRDDRLYPAYVLAATTGMRRGEVLGLRWQDVDLEAARVSIAQTVVVVGGYEAQLSEPKTAKGRRSVALDPTTVAALREQRERQLVERALMGDAYEDTDLVFAREDGTWIHPDAFSDAFWLRRAALVGLTVEGRVRSRTTGGRRPRRS